MRHAVASSRACERRLGARGASGVGSLIDAAGRPGPALLPCRASCSAVLAGELLNGPLRAVPSRDLAAVSLPSDASTWASVGLARLRRLGAGAPCRLRRLCSARHESGRSWAGPAPGRDCPLVTVPKLVPYCHHMHSHRGCISSEPSGERLSPISRAFLGIAKPMPYDPE